MESLKIKKEVLSKTKIYDNSSCLASLQLPTAQDERQEIYLNNNILNTQYDLEDKDNQETFINGIECDNEINALLKHVYIVTSPENQKYNIYKVGIHTGTIYDLIKRYKTYIPRLIILEFLECVNNLEVENKMKEYFEDNRIEFELSVAEHIKISKYVKIKSEDNDTINTMLSPNSKYSEWYCVNIDKLKTKLYEFVGECKYNDKEEVINTNKNKIVKELIKVENQKEIILPESKDKLYIRELIDNNKQQQQPRTEDKRKAQNESANTLPHYSSSKNIDSETKKGKLLELEPCQLEIKDKIVKELINKDRATMILPCGFGKTVISFYIAQEIGANKVLIVSPTIYLQTQNKDRWVMDFKGDISKCILIGSEGTTCLDDIENFISSNNNYYWIFSTYHSSYLMKNLKFDIVIFDEAHHLAGEIKNNFTSLLFEGRIRKRLFMTASPKIFASTICQKDVSGNVDSIANNNNNKCPIVVANHNTLGLNKGNIPDTMLNNNSTPQNIGTGSSGLTTDKWYSMDDETKFGKQVVRYNIRDGIRHKRLCDYKILCMAGLIPNLVDYSVFEGQTVNVYDAGLAILVNKAISESNCKRIMIFSNTKKEAKSLLNVFSLLFPNLWVKTVFGDAFLSKRKDFVNQFENNKPPTILISCYVFLEGFDVKNCDSIVFHSNKTSIISIIQAIGRTLRYQEGKIANIIIPFICESVSDFLNPRSTEFKKIREILKLIHNEMDIDEKFFIKFDEHISKKWLKEYSGIKQNLFGVNLTNKNIDIEILYSVIKLRILDVEDIEYRQISKQVALRNYPNIETYKKEAELFGFPLDPITYFDKSDFSWSDYLGHRKENYYNKQEIKTLITNYMAKNGYRTNNRDKILTTNKQDEIYGELKKIYNKVYWDFDEKFLGYTRSEIFPHYY